MNGPLTGPPGPDSCALPGCGGVVVPVGLGGEEAGSTTRTGGRVPPVTTGGGGGGGVPVPGGGGVGVSSSPPSPPPEAHGERVIVLVSSVTALELRVRIRPSTVAPVSRTLAPSDIVVPLNALPAPSVTPCVASDSCQNTLHVLGALPPLTMLTEPAASAAVVTLVP